MWFEKWLLSSIVLRENIIADAIHNVLSRTSTTVDIMHISRIETVIYIFKSLLKWPYIIFFGGIFTVIIVYYYKVRKQQHLTLIEKNRLKQLLPFLLVAIYPCIWLLGAANHSYIHPRLVYRIWGVSIFAIFSGLVYMLKTDEK